MRQTLLGSGFSRPAARQPLPAATPLSTLSVELRGIDESACRLHPVSPCFCGKGAVWATAHALKRSTRPVFCRDAKQNTLAILGLMHS